MVFEDGNLQGELALGGDALTADTVAGSEVKVTEVVVLKRGGSASVAVSFNVGAFVIGSVLYPPPPVACSFSNLRCGKLAKY